MPRRPKYQAGDKVFCVFHDRPDQFEVTSGEVIDCHKQEYRTWSGYRYTVAAISSIPRWEHNVDEDSICTDLKSLRKIINEQLQLLNIKD